MAGNPCKEHYRASAEKEGKIPANKESRGAPVPGRGGGELEVSFASGTAAVELPRSPGTPTTFGVFAASGLEMCPGRSPGKGRGWRLPHPPGGVWHLRLLPAMLAGLGPGLEPQAATGGCRHSRPHSGSAAPSPGCCQAGPSCCPPAPPASGSSLPGAGSAAEPGPTAPAWPPTASAGFPRVKECKCFRNTSTFF